MLPYFNMSNVHPLQRGGERAKSDKMDSVARYGDISQNMAILKIAWRGKSGDDSRKSGDFLAWFGSATKNCVSVTFEGVLAPENTSKLKSLV